MKNLSSFYGKPLKFTQPSVWKTYYELKSDNEILGTVKKIKKFGFQLEINIFKNKWIFYRPSFWRSEIAIRQSGYTLPYAKYKGGKFKQHGMIELPKGGRVKIVFKAFKKDYELQDSSGQVLVKLADKVKFRTSVDISIIKRSELIDKYPWVLILAWYISALRKRAAAAG
ncbi:MAG: hypothetical protein P8Z35_03110 [Ignavibacteriaceae bacterium]|jgi:hypothetical protein